ncbi:MAG: FapA family protein [Oscillospiraceae bacterium]|nr:FapA family protein [Oscillospiraceae bacterium]
MGELTNQSGIISVNSPESSVPPPIDAKINITVDTNYKEAVVSISAPQNGGKDFTVEDITEELKKKSVVFGIDMQLLQRIFEDKSYNTPYVVAKYLPPENGENGTISYNFEKEYKPKPKINDEGVVDYKDIGVVQIVSANTVIAEITKPTDGNPGYDIRNKALPQKKGDKAKFSIGKNVNITADGLRLVAAADGVLNWVGEGFSVETTLTVDNVDNSTGHIRFIGDIVVRGEIQEGFKVYSDRSVVVHGAVSGAVVEALGDIEIKSGCMRTNIKSGGNVKASFFENCTIKNDGNVSAQSFAFCNISCGGSIVTSGAGVIFGGQCVCLGNVHCSVLGSKNYIKTEVIVGNTALFVKERSQIQEYLKELDEEILGLTRDVKYLMERKATLGQLNREKQASLDYCMRQRMLKKRIHSEKEKRIEEINQLLATKKYHEIVCRGAAYPNVIICIGEASQVLSGKYTNVTFTQNEDDKTINIIV